MTTDIYSILTELNETNSTNNKLKVLKNHKNNELLMRVLKMTYDKVIFTYGVSLQNVLSVTPSHEELTLEAALDVLEFELCTRDVTGNDALQAAANCIYSLNDEDSEVFQRVINRNIKCNLGRTQINKTWPGLITKPVYMRCGVYCPKTQKKLKTPFLVQLKADGTYREFTIINGEIQARSRQGEMYSYPLHFGLMKNFPDGVYQGELTVRGVSDRSEGNGLINSDNPPHDDIILDLWDCISLQEYKNAAFKIKNTTHYQDRFKKLNEIISCVDSDSINIIESHEVDTVQEALVKVSEWMSNDYEGGVLKNLDGLFRDGNSPDQLKLKLSIDVEMRVQGFKDGKKGTKREGKVGSIQFRNDEGTIQGFCSGFNDKQFNDMTNNPDGYLNKIITVEFNDLSKSRNHDYYALSHPRFIEVRNDKDETDTLEKAFELREMAMNLK